MNLNKFLLFSLILCLFLNAVSAADNDTVNADPIVLTGNTFADIQSEIDTTTESVIYLGNKTYTQTGSNCIIISKNITIDGSDNGVGISILDADEKSISFVICKDAVVCLKNIHITRTSTTGNGGLSNEGILTIDNCNFSECSAKWGSAIYNNKNGVLKVNNSYFLYNGASYATICNTGTAIVEKSNFYGNEVENYCSGIYNNGNLTVTSSIFNYSGAESSSNIYGGVICNSKGNLTIYKSIFEGNQFISISDNVYGGVIYSNGQLNLHDSIFLNNIAGPSGSVSGKKVHGGAIYSINSALITNSTFYTIVAIAESNVYSHGGAIYASGNLTIDGCTFNRTASVPINSKQLGGAVYNKGNTNIYNSNFLESISYNGGSIYNSGNLAVENSSFKNCMAFSEGGVIYNSKNADIKNSNFEYNEARYYGGAISNSGLININNSNFTANNATDKGGSIYGDGKININGSIFKNHNIGTAINKFGGAICIYSSSSDKPECNITNSLFINNTAYSGGAVDLSGKSIVSNTTFIDNFAKSGGAVAAGSSLAIAGSTFINNSAEQGGAIKNTIGGDNLLKVLDSTFINNSVVEPSTSWSPIGGGAIWVNSNVEIANSNFIGNTVANSRILDGGGAIVVKSANANISNSNFTNNNGKRGGAVLALLQYGNDKCNIHIDNSNFAFNDGSMGGAVYVEQTFGSSIPGGDVNITDSTFASNNATYGGAVYTNLQGSNNYGVNLIDSTFASNNATYGGVIYNKEQTNEAMLMFCQKNINCTFENNTAKSGSVIYTTGSHMNTAVDNCNFINNPAAEGVIYTTAFSNADISNSNLAGNGHLIYDDGSINSKNNTMNSDIAPIFVTSNGRVANINFIVLNNSTVKSLADGVNITALLCDDNNNAIEMTSANVTLNINGTEVTPTPDKSGIYSYYYTPTDLGLVDISATVSNVGTVTVQNAKVNVVKPSDITIQPINKTSYGENITIKVNVTPTATGNVTLKINNKTYNTTELTGNEAIFIVKNIIPGINNVTVIYEGDEYFYNSTDSSTFIVDKTNTTMNITSVINDTSANITVKIGIDATGNITLNYDGKKLTQTIVNGTVLFQLTNLKSGKYNITASYAGDERYNSQIAKSNFTIDKINTKLSFTVVGGLVFVNLSENATGSVILTINGTNLTSPVINGTAKFDLSNFGSGNYTISAYYPGDNQCNEASNKSNITLKFISTDIISNDVVKYVKNGTALIIMLVDSNNNPLANKTLSIIINNVTYTRVTNSDGMAKMNINLNQGNYSAFIQFEGEDLYTKSNKTVNITVIPNIVGNDLVKYFRNGSQFKVVLLDKQGNILAGKRVTFNINGVFYNRTSNDEGIATLNINLNQGSYIITTQYEDCMISNNITVLPIIIGNDLVKYFKNESQYTVKLLDKSGNAIANKTVIFNINGVFYNRTSNDEGIATLNINLNAGEYIVSAIYDDNIISNTIEVLPTIISEDRVINTGEKVPFNVTVLDGKGKIAPNQNVTFNIDGIVSNKISDANGVASLDINLTAGKYIITTYYNGLFQSNNITII